MPTGITPCISVALGHIEHIGQAMCIGKGIVLLASLQQEGEGGQLLGTGVEINTCEVMTEDVLDGFATAIAFGNVEVVEQVETFVEDMT